MTIALPSAYDATCCKALQNAASAETGRAHGPLLAVSKTQAPIGDRGAGARPANAAFGENYVQEAHGQGRAPWPTWAWNGT